MGFLGITRNEWRKNINRNVLKSKCNILITQKSYQPFSDTPVLFSQADRKVERDNPNNIFLEYFNRSNIVHITQFP